jgi:hypothetical protein
MRGGRTLLHFDDGALDLVACTDAHDESFIVYVPFKTTVRIDKAGLKKDQQP